MKNERPESEMMKKPYPYAPQKIDITQLHKTIPYQICPPFLQDFMDFCAEQVTEKEGNPEDNDHLATRRFFNFFHCWKNKIGLKDEDKCGFTLITSYSPATWSAKLRWWYDPTKSDTEIVFQPSSGEEIGPDRSIQLKVPKNILQISIQDGPKEKIATQIYNFIDEILRTDTKYGPCNEILATGGVGRLESGPGFSRRVGLVQEVDKLPRPNNTQLYETFKSANKKGRWGDVDQDNLARDSKRASLRRSIEQE